MGEGDAQIKKVSNTTLNITSKTNYARRTATRIIGRRNWLVKVRVR